MRARTLSVGLIAVVFLCGEGCKSTPKMAWWKKSEATTPAAVAHAAPTLPSEVARQAEGMSAVDPVQIETNSGSLAATTAHSQSLAPSAPESYPNTGAPGYLPKAAQASTTAVASTGSTALPYDPSTVPPSKNSDGTKVASVAAPTVAPASGDRYAGSYEAAAPAYSPAPVSQATAAPTAPIAKGSTSILGDRYASVDVSSYQASASSEPACTTADCATVAATTSFRPGGTSTYPGSSAGSATYELAARPATTSEGTTAPGTGESYPAQSGSLQYR